jgi:hypothetical protein
MVSRVRVPQAGQVMMESSIASMMAGFRFAKRHRLE